MATQKIVGIMGVSGAGKSTILGRIVELSPEIRVIPTITDRPTRGGEIGREHAFVTSDKFTELIEQNKFSYSVQPFGLPYRYGVLSADIHASQPSILMLRSMFVNSFKEAFPEGVLVNIDAPAATIQKRITDRGDDAEAIAKRLNNYIAESSQGRKLCDYNFAHEDSSTDVIAKAIIKILYSE